MERSSPPFEAILRVSAKELRHGSPVPPHNLMAPHAASISRRAPRATHEAAAPLPTENSSNRLLRDWCWLWCWCWCCLLLVVLDVVLAGYVMQMTMT